MEEHPTDDDPVVCPCLPSANGNESSTPATDDDNNGSTTTASGTNSPTSSSSQVDPEFIHPVLTGHLEPEVLRLTNALRRLQIEVMKVDGQRFKDVHVLEEKYAALFKPYFEKRRQIIAGEYEPTDEECEFPLEEDEHCAMLYYKKFMADKKAEAEANNTPLPIIPTLPGIPGFWRQIMKNVKRFRDLVQEYDKPILEHLIDVHYEICQDPLSYTLVFYFSKNRYFSNPTLTKTYGLRIGDVNQILFWVNGLEVYEATGCEINWYPGRSVMEVLHTVEQSQPDGGPNKIQNLETCDSQFLSSSFGKSKSFFHFFNMDPVECPSDLTFIQDAQLGKFIKERIVVKAILFFTGEATYGVYDTYSEPNSLTASDPSGSDEDTEVEVEPAGHKD